jgi:hypothetical protein
MPITQRYGPLTEVLIVNGNNFQDRFSVNIWGGVFGSQDIGPFVFEKRLTSERYLRFLEDVLPVLLNIPTHIRREL